MADGESNTVKLRSIYSGSVSALHDAEAQSGDSVSPISASFRNLLSDNGGRGGKAQAGRDDDDDVDDTKDDDDEYEDLDESEVEPLTLPESTHTLFFTQPVFSIPFCFAVGIVFISVMCLIMALLNNLQDRTPGNPLNVPVNVSINVRIAQYLAILIALLMEEEIPTGLYLLRMVPSSSFKEKFPKKSYRKYVSAAILRIVMGYAFLINVYIILAQADGVLAIFYDVLALQFIQQLDDIAFSLAKMDVLGKRLQRACTAKLFQTEFEKKKFGRMSIRDSLRRGNRRASIFLKSIYFFNLVALLGGMLYISMRQTSGYYQCESVTANWGEKIWEDAFVEGRGDSTTLVFAYFNGVYEKNGTHAGRPVYQERRKFDRSKYEDRIPAEIKYSDDDGAWIFTHKDIRKSESDDSFWILRSPQTDTYDLLDVSGTDWQVWVGIIGTTRVTFSCNTCNDDVDCNLNGECVNGECVCNSGGGTKYIGMHCEGKIKDGCQSIISEQSNATFSLQYYSDSGLPPFDKLFQEYARPVYSHVKGIPNITDDDIFWLVYAGSRWFGMNFNLVERNMTLDDLLYAVVEFHAFWGEAYNDVTFYVSDPTDGYTPVGVDWFNIMERGEQFGPFGALQPIQMYNQSGRGYFRCAGEYIPPFSDTNSTDSTIDANSTIDTNSTRRLKFLPGF